MLAYNITTARIMTPFFLVRVSQQASQIIKQVLYPIKSRLHLKGFGCKSSCG